MKNVFKILGILIVVLLFVGCIFIFWILNSKDYIVNKKIMTEYGDTFIINCDFQHKWRIHDENGFDIRLQYYDETDEIIGIWNTAELRCYLIGNVIIYPRADSESFNKFDEDLYSNEEMIPVILSILLKGNNIFETYLPYFYNEFPNETSELIQNLIERNFEKLIKYGLTSDILSDEYEISKMIDTANTINKNTDNTNMETVKNKAKYDIKCKKPWVNLSNTINAGVPYYHSAFPFVFRGEEINAEMFGNILFGYICNAGGFSSSIITGGGSLYSKLTEGKFDNPEDTACIIKGYNMYEDVKRDYDYLHITN